MSNELLYKVAKGELTFADDEQISRSKKFAAQLQSQLSSFWLLPNGSADGLWGDKSSGALSRFKTLRGIHEAGCGKITASELINTDPSSVLRGYKLNGDWASRALMWLSLHNFYFTDKGNIGEINIVYFRGLNKQGNWDGNASFVWNDRRTVLVIKNGIPSFAGNWLATVDPGEYYWENPMNPKGCADIKAWQFQAWSVGDHKDQHALIQSDKITVYRGENRVPDIGDDFSIDQHTTHGDYSSGEDVSRWSAGCLVGASQDEHYQEFMPLVDNDPREKSDRGSYKHYTTVINGNDFLNYFPNN
ncbi:MAG: hypothetical protein DSM106950_18230 [Stigonema ocellatum SAG 48.90 = DSM 106950]|nr:hypothetical protein [Stigonema ocellatum SAG 48.90 = DSM 106950]